MAVTNHTECRIRVERSPTKIGELVQPPLSHVPVPVPVPVRVDVPEAMVSEKDPEPFDLGARVEVPRERDRVGRPFDHRQIGWHNLTMKEWQFRAHKGTFEMCCEKV